MGHLLASSSNHSKFRYRVYSIKRMCDYFFFWWGKKDYCCCCWCFGLELLYGNCKTWCSLRFQKLCTSPPPSPPEFIIHAVYPANNKPKKQEQRNTTSSYLAHAPLLLLLFLFSLFLSTCLCFLSTNSFTYHIPFWNPCQKVKL